MAADDPPSEAHLEALRSAYVMASPRQRIEVAMQRVERLDCGPNVLIVEVSAVEALARSLLYHHRVQSGEDEVQAYKAIRNNNAKQLLAGLASGLEIQIEEEARLQFHIAVDYRNLLIHEATFLNQGTTNTLLGSVRRVWAVLVENAKPPGG